REGVDPDRKIMTEFQYLHKNGGLVWLESVISAIRDKDGSITGIHGVSRDITERKHAEEEKRRLEDQLAHARKMESIGTMAGGIAHDFNNILSAIFGHAELALEDLSNHNKLIKHLKEVLKAGDRARDLVRQILAFSRKAESRYVPLELRKVIRESLKMMRSVIPATIEIRQELLETGLVMSDPTQINQIMMNLCTNAVHAMDESGGLLIVGLRKVMLEDKDARSLDLVSGPYLKMTVSDTGQGMTPDVMERIFDPYYTTKGLGQGTGLGLSVVHGIVKSHGGGIICRSTPGQGTAFDVYLPELESAVEIVETQGQKTCARGNERILFIDDEPSLASLAEEMLSNLGYRMTSSTMPEEALDLLMNDPYAFDLVITDMTMPGMRGDQLARKIMEIRRDMPVILCTGFSEHINEDKALKMGIRAYVLKPLQMNAMSDTIRKVLDEQWY
ncbi:response regulator, partial [bacterium]|nr:response regulator [bacterium]